MIHSKLVSWAICIAFVALNLVGFGISRHRRQQESEMQRRMNERMGRQGVALERWHSVTPIAINTSTFRAALHRLKPSDRPTVEGTVRLSRDELSSEQASDLMNAVHGLAAAYRSGKPSSLIQYMSTRQEELQEDAVGSLRRYLIERHGFTEDEFSGLGVDEQFEMFWDVLGVAPEWRSFIAEHSDIALFRSTGNATTEAFSDTAQISGEDVELWQHVAARHHHFGNPGDKLDTQLASENGATFADVRLVVKHNGKGMHTICPYTVRFWYSEQRECWVPHLLAQFRTSRDIPRKLLF